MVARSNATLGCAQNDSTKIFQAIILPMCDQTSLPCRKWKRRSRRKFYFHQTQQSNAELPPWEGTLPVTAPSPHPTGAEWLRDFSAPVSRPCIARALGVTNGQLLPLGSQIQGCFGNCGLFCPLLTNPLGPRPWRW